jgi:hypothetical protein
MYKNPGKAKMSTLHEMATDTNDGKPVNWLDTLKVGDEVAVSHYGEYSLCRIERETPTQWVLGGLRFRKSDGSQVGAETWSMRHLSMVTQDMRDALELRRLVNNLSARDLWKGLDLHQLRAVWAFMKQLKEAGIKEM